MTHNNDQNIGSADFNDELQQMRRKKARKARKRRIIIGVIVAVAAAVTLIIVFVQMNRSYSSFSIVSSEAREDESGAEYAFYKDGYIRCSGGGVERVGSDGEKVWNRVHSMTSPSVKIRGNIIAIGDINGNSIEVYDDSGIIGHAETQFSILQIEVSSDGLVAAVLQDNNDSYINMYDKKGDYIYSIKTSIGGEGYPVDIAVSNDGQKLAVSYVKTSGKNLETGVALYDFSRERGSELVAQFNNFSGNPVGVVEFFGNDTLIAVSGKDVTYYSADEAKEKKKTEIADTVNKVIFGDNKFALIYSSGNIQVYGSGGNVISEVEEETLYTDYRFYDNRIIMKSDTSFAVMDVSGKFVTKQDTELPVLALVPNGPKDRYFFINEKFIQRIRLT